MNPKDLPPRIARRIVTDENGCWIWTGAKQTKGYGSIGYEAKIHLAHRLVYTLLVGQVPDGLQIDHTCRVKACVNPDHLEAVTSKVNNHRAHDGYRLCKNGHDLDVTGYQHPKGNRECGVCRNDRAKAHRATRRVGRNVPVSLVRAFATLAGIAPGSIDSISIEPDHGVTLLYVGDDGALDSLPLRILDADLAWATERAG